MSYVSYSGSYFEEGEGNSSLFAIYESDDCEATESSKKSSSNAAAGTGMSSSGGGGSGSEAPCDKPKILLMGLRRSGKSSIHKVVFHKMSPNESLFLESNNVILYDSIAHSSYVQFSIWDFPGQIDFLDSSFNAEKIFKGTGAIIFVIDAQDDYRRPSPRSTASSSKPTP
ncbi:Rasrelated GTPbinding protein Dlike [Caligus rogercresseyi]|uniref:Rasrelated GTPbinding protein Dlike n=1 Tax=Caligus rogercresseyi TaxID=217165 RepID=A0A7T8QRR9_CALRO|nr:Rasrelated GTPbinding protein Dlike [Caligus rogercresseyi]